MKYKDSSETTIDINRDIKSISFNYDDIYKLSRIEISFGINQFIFRQEYLDYLLHTPNKIINITADCFDNLFRTLMTHQEFRIKIYYRHEYLIHNTNPSSFQYENEIKPIIEYTETNIDKNTLKTYYEVYNKMPIVTCCNSDYYISNKKIMQPIYELPSNYDGVLIKLTYGIRPVMLIENEIICENGMGNFKYSYNVK